MKAFRHKITGRVELYPDTEFWRSHPHMELVEDSGGKRLAVSNEVLIVVPNDNDEEEEAVNE